MTLGDRLERCPEVPKRFDIIELTGLDQGRGAGPGLRAFVVPGEQMVLSSKSQGADPVLDRIAVHLDMAVSEEHLQPAPAVVDICEMLTQTRFGSAACPFLLNRVWVSISPI